MRRALESANPIMHVGAVTKAGSVVVLKVESVVCSPSRIPSVPVRVSAAQAGRDHPMAEGGKGQVSACRGFIQNEDEPCVYKKVSGSHVAFLVLYVDDIFLIGNDIPFLQAVKTWLGKSFSMKDLGDATYILGIKIYRDRSKRLIGLSQSTYIDKVLHRFGMQEAKRGFVPMSHGIMISKEDCPKSSDDKDRMNKVPYASVIGSIIYVMICTRSDVSYALSMTSRYQSIPGEGHSTAVKNILKYHKRTKDSFLI